MSTTHELRSEVQTLHQKVREVLLLASEKAAPGVLPLLPKNETDRISAVQAAGIRWELLQAGFTYDEVSGILSKLNANNENKLPFPQTTPEWTHFVEEKYLGFITPETHRFTLVLKQRAYSRRLVDVPYNAHERAVISIAKRLQALLSTAAEQKEAIVLDLAKSTGVQPEMIWRVATGGTRVTGGILMKLDHHLRALENELDGEDAVDG